MAWNRNVKLNQTFDSFQVQCSLLERIYCYVHEQGVEGKKMLGFPWKSVNTACIAGINKNLVTGLAQKNFRKNVCIFHAISFTRPSFVGASESQSERLQKGSYYLYRMNHTLNTNNIILKSIFLKSFLQRRTRGSRY